MSVENSRFFSYNTTIKYDDAKVREELPHCDVQFITPDIFARFECKAALSWWNVELLEDKNIAMQICRGGAIFEGDLGSDKTIKDSPVCSDYIPVKNTKDAIKLIGREVNYEENRANNLGCNYEQRIDRLREEYFKQKDERK